MLGKIIFLFTKTLRYISYFGLGRTLAFIKGQRHTRATIGFEGEQWTNTNATDSDVRIVGIIGTGKFAYSHIAYFLSKLSKEFLVCCYSPGRKTAVSLCKNYNGLYVPSDWREILNDQRVKLVYIASSAFSHASYAIKALRAGKNIYIEKPHVVKQEELSLLENTMKENPNNNVYLGFNRTSSKLFKKLKNLSLKEEGPITGSTYMISSNPEGTDKDSSLEEAIFDHVSHHSDLILNLIGVNKAFPCTILPIKNNRDGDMLDICASVTFADASQVSFNYSEVPDLASGMQERIEITKGKLFALLEDFGSLKVEQNGKRKKFSTFFRDHGHKEHITHAYKSCLEGKRDGLSIEQVSATARLYLGIATALQSGQSVELN